DGEPRPRDAIALNRRVGKGDGTAFHRGTVSRAPCPRVSLSTCSARSAWARRTIGTAKTEMQCHRLCPPYGSLHLDSPRLNDFTGPLGLALERAIELRRT